MEHAYDFPEYNDSALLKILIAKAKKLKLASYKERVCRSRDHLPNDLV